MISKEFYTPLQPRSVTFFQQSVQDVGRVHKKSESINSLRGDHSRGSPHLTLDYGTHLGIFVVFDKKAGWIRIADSAVGELELHDSGNSQQQRSGDSSSPVLTTSGVLRSRSRVSLEGHNNHTHTTARWVPPVHCELPSLRQPGMMTKVLLLTKAKQTHIVPYPLPIGPSSYPPLYKVSWSSAPTSISARLCGPFVENGNMFPPFLQLIAFSSENGIEVQEVSLSFLGKGKGKARFEEPVCAEEDLGGESGFLCRGGHWDRRQVLNRSYSFASMVSQDSFDSTESGELAAKLKREEGVYGWCRKGLQDWRVFWVGGSLSREGNDVSYGL